MKGLIVIPAYNEEESIFSTVEELKLWIDKNNINIDYVVVNDGSKDKTLDVLKENNYNYVSHIINKGLDCALKTGILYGVKENYDYLLQYDGDGQHKPEYILEMIKEIENGCDVVIGSRFLNDKKPWSMRMLGSKIISNLLYIRVGFKKKITDPTSGQRMINRRTMINLSYDSVVSEPAYISKYINKGYNIKEIKVTMREREAGESHFNLINSIYYMLEQTMSILLGY